MSLRRAVLALAVLAFADCKIEKTQEGELPEGKREGSFPSTR